MGFKRKLTHVEYKRSKLASDQHHVLLIVNSIFCQNEYSVSLVTALSVSPIVHIWVTLLQ